MCLWHLFRSSICVDFHSPRIVLEFMKIYDEVVACRAQTTLSTDKSGEFCLFVSSDRVSGVAIGTTVVLQCLIRSGKFVV